MASAIDVCVALMIEAVERTSALSSESSRERYAGAWGYLMGSLIRLGANPKIVERLIVEPSRHRAEGMKPDAIMQAVGESLFEVVSTTPETMIAIEPEEAVKDMACRFILEVMKHGLVIVDRTSYDRLITENRDLGAALMRAAMRESVKA